MIANRTILNILVLFLINGTISANEYYVTIGLTQSQATIEAPSSQALLGDKADVEGSAPLTLFRISLGMKFNQYVAIEGLLATGLAEEDVLSGPATDTNGNIVNYDTTIQSTIFAVSYLVLQWPIIEKVFVEGRIGYGYVNYYSSLTYSANGRNDFIEGNDSGSGIAYGVAAIYQAAHHGIGAHYDVYPDLNFEVNDKVTTAGYSLVYRYQF